MRYLTFDRYTVKTPITQILDRLRLSLANGKLKDIIKKQDDLVVTCPHHDGGHESKPACNIYIGDDPKLPYGYFRCFVCNEKGDFIKFVAECFDSSLDYAKQWLLNNFEYTETPVALDLGADICLKKQRKPKYLDDSILRRSELQSYCPYLAERGVSREVCTLFNVKYDSKYRQIVFPCYDANGNLLGLPTRAINRKIFYIDKNRQKPVYGLDKIVSLGLRRFLIVEGFFDCLVCWTHKVPAVALLGTPAREQLQEIQKLSPQFIYIATDNDAAGDEIASTVGTALDRRIFTERIRAAAGRKDVAEMTSVEWQNFIKKYNLPQLDRI